MRQVLPLLLNKLLIFEMIFFTWIGAGSELFVGAAKPGCPEVKLFFLIESKSLRKLEK